MKTLQQFSEFQEAILLLEGLTQSGCLPGKVRAENRPCAHWEPVVVNPRADAWPAMAQGADPAMLATSAGQQGNVILMAHYDGSMRQVMVSKTEVPFPLGEMSISQTDPKGMITMVNETLVRLSGYSRAELIGAPHHILRHPDMPAAVFKGLWEDVSSGKKWYGYIKNLRKDGAFYWAYATVVPNVRHGETVGYTMATRQPSRAKVAEAEALYRNLMSGFC